MPKRQTEVSASDWKGWNSGKSGIDWEVAQGTWMLNLKPLRIHLVLTQFRKIWVFQILADQIKASPIARFKDL